MNQSCPIVELHFPIEGKTLPSDHGYFLFSAISRIMPEAHQAEWLGIHTIRGIRQVPGIIRLTGQEKLRLRLPADRIPSVYVLAGKSLIVSGHRIRCGIPEVHPIHSSRDLRARAVVIKSGGSNPLEPQPFFTAVTKQLEVIGVTADAELETQRTLEREVPVRRILRLKQITLVGYTVILKNLNESDSLKIQYEGIGGRRRMGCGLFLPINNRH